MSAREVRAGKAWVDILARANLGPGLSAAGQTLRSWGTGLATKGAGLAAVGAVIGGPLAAATAHFVATGSDLTDMADRTGASAQSLAELSYAAALSGTELATVEGALAKWQKRLSASAETGGADLAKYGLRAAELAAMTPTEQLGAVADALAKIDNPAQRTAAAMDLLGKSGAQLLPMLAGGSAGLAQMAADARRLGLVMSQEDIAAAAQLGDQFDVLTMLAGGLQNTIGAALAPSLINAAEYLIDAGAAARQFMDENRGLVVAVGATAAGLVVAGGALVATGGALWVAGAGLSVVGGALTAAVSPLGLVTGGLAAGAYAWTTYTEAGQAASTQAAATFGEIKTTAETTMQAVADAFEAGDLALVGETVLAGLKVAWIQGLQGLEAVTGAGLADIAQAFTSGDLAGAAGLAWDQITLAAEQSALDTAAAWEETATGFAQMWDDFTSQAATAFDTVANKGVKTAAALANKWADAIQSYGAFGLSQTGLMSQDEAQGLIGNIPGGIRAVAGLATAGAQAGVDANAGDRSAAGQAAAAQRGQQLQTRLDALQARRDKLAGQAAAPSPDLAAGRSAAALAAAQSDLLNARHKAGLAVDNARRDARDRAAKPPPDLELGGNKTAGTFSAFAAGLLGMGGRDRQAAIELNTANLVELFKRWMHENPPDQAGEPAAQWTA